MHLFQRNSLKMDTEMDFWLALRSIEAHVYLVRGICCAIASCVPLVI